MQRAAGRPKDFEALADSKRSAKIAGGIEGRQR
jgi:hypothetical protein